MQPFVYRYTAVWCWNELNQRVWAETFQWDAIQLLTELEARAEARSRLQGETNYSILSIAVTKVTVEAVAFAAY